MYATPTNIKFSPKPCHLLLLLCVTLLLPVPSTALENLTFYSKADCKGFSEEVKLVTSKQCASFPGRTFSSVRFADPSTDQVRLRVFSYRGDEWKGCEIPIAMSRTADECLSGELHAISGAKWFVNGDGLDDIVVGGYDSSGVSQEDV